MVCWQGSLSLYQQGEMVLSRTVFTTPVLGLTSTDQVVLVNTYSHVLVWARHSLLQSNTVTELQVGSHSHQPTPAHFTSLDYIVHCRE